MLLTLESHETYLFDFASLVAVWLATLLAGLTNYEIRLCFVEHGARIMVEWRDGVERCFLQRDLSQTKSYFSVQAQYIALEIAHEITEPLRNYAIGRSFVIGVTEADPQVPIVCRTASGFRLDREDKS